MTNVEEQERGQKKNIASVLEARTLLVFVKEQEKEKEKRGPSFFDSSLFTRPQNRGSVA